MATLILALVCVAGAAWVAFKMVKLACKPIGK